MPEQKRTNWRTEGRYNYTAVDRYRGDVCVYPEFIGLSRKKAEKIADALNSAYQKGREEMMTELAELFAQEGGQFYINQMLTLEAGAKMGRDLREDSLPYFQPDDEKAFADSYRSGETLCRNHACAARGTPHSHTERDIRSEVVPLPPLPHNPSLGCCAEHFNAAGRKAAEEARQESVRKAMESDENAFLDWDRGD